MFLKNCIKLIALILITSACQTRGIKWNPDFYMSDYQNVAIVNEKGHVIYADQEEFNGFACLSEGKVKELAEILKKARMPRELKRNLLEKLPKNHIK